MKTAVIYSRVSTDEQANEGKSIEVQIDICRRWANENKYSIVGVFEEPGKSGTNMNRPGLTALLARCSSGDVTNLIIQDTSRLSRDTKDYLSITALLKKNNVNIIALTGMQSFGDDPYEQFMNEILASVNALHPRISGYKSKQTAIEKFKFGIYPSWAPVGYKNDKNPNPTCRYDQRIVVIDPEKAPFIKQAFKLYATKNHSIYSVRKYLHNNGVRGQSGRPLAYSLVHNILQNSFYYGYMKWGGLEGMGKHEPIISKKLFDSVQRTLSQRGKNGIRMRKHNFLLRGVVFCKKCGRRYTAEWHKDKKKFAHRGGKIGYYHCSGVGRVGKCKSPYVEVEQLERSVEKEVEKLEFTKEFIEAVKQNVQRIYEEANNRVKKSKKAAYNRRDALEIKREKLEEELLAETISRERFKTLNAKIEKDLTDVQKELVKINSIRTIDISVVDEVLALTRNIAKTYKDSDTNAKRVYLRFFFSKINVQNKKIDSVEYQPVIHVLNQAKLGILSTNLLPLIGTFINNPSSRYLDKQSEIMLQSLLAYQDNRPNYIGLQS